MSSLVNSKHQKLSQDEIIAIAAKETGGKYTAEQVKASLVLEAHEMKALMLREGNTIFVVHQSKTEPTTGLFRPLNADTIPNFKHNCVVFAKAIGLAGFKKMIAQFDDKSLIAIIKYVVNKHPPFPNMSYKLQRVEDGQYAVTINMGDAKKGGLPDQAQPVDQGAL